MRRKAESSTAKVWHGGGRRYFTKVDAARGEARAFLKRLCKRSEKYLDEPEWKREVKRVMKLVLARWKMNAKPRQLRLPV